MVEPGFGEWLPLRANSRHSYRFEAPDIFHVRDEGDCDADDFSRMFDLVEETAAREGRRLFWLADISKLRRVSDEARRLTRRRNVAASVRGTAVYGGSFHQRILANMMSKAIRVLKPDWAKSRTIFLRHGGRGAGVRGGRAATAGALVVRYTEP